MGITLSTKPSIISSNSEQQSVTQHFYAKDKYAKVIVDNKFMVSKLIANINGKEYTFELNPNILKRNAEIDISKYIKKGKNTVIFYYPLDEGDKKALRLYVELVKKADSDYIW